LDRTVEKELKLPLYYTGLTKTALISRRGGKPKKHELDRRYEVRIPISVEPMGVTWYVVE